ncbi:outer membrane protein assembly factor BamB family protein [Fibrella arboris]|uniref:outer membrane protein assembly factor BamB family protein n=1 Tax=Fibrella arboris TaxID=3242486 RepID=UPI003520EB35
MKNIAYFLLWVSLALPLIIGLQNCRKDDPAPPANPGGPGSSTTTPGGSTTSSPGTSTTAVVSTAPLISTLAAPTISATGSTSATVSVVIESAGGTVVTEHGFVLSNTNTLPTIADFKQNFGIVNGPFPYTVTRTVTGLEANTTYYIRAFATSATGTGYGAVGQFRTTAPPVVTNPDDAAIIYVGMSYGVYAVDVATGRPKTTFSTTGGSVYADPTLDNNVLYTGFNSVLGFNTGGGRLWELTTLSGSFTNPITVGGGVFYVVANDKLVAYDATTRAKKWEVVAQNGNSPVLLDGVLYEASNSGLAAINAADGARKWLYASGIAMYTGAAVSGGVAYATGQRNTLHAVDITTGLKKWSYEMGTTFDVLSSCPTVANNVVYVGSGDKRLYAVDAVTGTKKWDFLTGGTVYSSPFVANGIVYFFSSDTNLYALDAATGARKWSVKIGTNGTTFSTTSPIVINGVVYVSGENKTLYALDGATGAVKWQLSITENLTSSPVGVTSNGKVFYSGRSGAQQ